MKSKLSKSVFLGAATALLPFFIGDTRANVLNSTISVEDDFPSLGHNDFSNYNPNPITVTSGGTSTSETPSIQSSVTATVFPDLLTIQFTCASFQLCDGSSNALGFASGPGISFNGTVFTVTSGNPFDPVSSVSGLDPSRISDTGTTLALNFAGLFLGGSFSSGGSSLPLDISISFAPTTTTPLPAALPLFATGLGGLGLLGWRRKRRAQRAGIGTKRP